MSMVSRITLISSAIEPDNAREAVYRFGRYCDRSSWGDFIREIVIYGLESFFGAATRIEIDIQRRMIVKSRSFIKLASRVFNNSYITPFEEGI